MLATLRAVAVAFTVIGAAAAGGYLAGRHADPVADAPTASPGTASSVAAGISRDLERLELLRAGDAAALKRGIEASLAAQVRALGARRDGAGDAGGPAVQAAMRAVLDYLARDPGSRLAAEAGIERIARDLSK